MNVPFLLTAIKKRQAQGAIWRQRPAATTAAGNELHCHYSTNKQTKSRITHFAQTKRSYRKQNPHSRTATGKTNKRPSECEKTKPHAASAQWSLGPAALILRWSAKTQKNSSPCSTDTVQIATGRKFNKNQFVMKAKRQKHIKGELRRWSLQTSLWKKGWVQDTRNISA